MSVEEKGVMCLWRDMRKKKKNRRRGRGVEAAQVQVQIDWIDSLGCRCSVHLRSALASVSQSQKSPPDPYRDLLAANININIICMINYIVM